MPKLITFKAPALDKGEIVTIEKQGYVANLYVGNVQEKFVLQIGADGAPEFLVHYATGQKFGSSLNSVKVRNMLRYGHAHHTSDREAAKQIIEETVAQIGADKVFEVIKRATVYNEA